MSHEALFELLDEAQQRRQLRPLDTAFAHFLAERDPRADDGLLLLAALASCVLGDGHPCLDLRDLPALLDASAWPLSWLPVLQRARLTPSTLLADASGMPASAPLVLDRQRLYLRRYWHYEGSVAATIRARLHPPVAATPALRTALRELFPAAGLDWQRIACALAAASDFSVITGGPGTGKTTTVVRLLGLLQHQRLQDGQPPLRIRLAAPTGKAAARLQTSIAQQLTRLPLAESVRALVPHDVATVHRLLGARPDTRRYSYDAQHPLHLDVLVVDEASMVDLEMMAALLAALPPHARLILLGDKDQLSSVEAGAVLGELARRAEPAHYSDETATWLLQASGDEVQPWVRDDATALDQHIVMLRHSHRFGGASGIGQLATAVNAGDEGTVNALFDQVLSDVSWHAELPVATLAVDNPALGFADSAQMPAQGFGHYLRQLQSQRPADNADMARFQHWADGVLQAFGHFQLLCAVRQGRYGSERSNRDIAARLLEQGLLSSDRGWYEGRPVMMTRNDYSLGLMNGDVGIALRMPGSDGQLRLYAVFALPPDAGQAADQRVRCVLPSRLGEVETVFAMTVHKSQGSEFEHTALLLPEEDSPLLTRELLYTGITRARQRLSLLGSRSSIERALRQHTRRYSGLAERLQG